MSELSYFLKGGLKVGRGVLLTSAIRSGGTTTVRSTSLPGTSVPQAMLPTHMTATPKKLCSICDLSTDIAYETTRAWIRKSTNLFYLDTSKRPTGLEWGGGG